MSLKLWKFTALKGGKIAVPRLETVVFLGFPGLCSAPEEPVRQGSGCLPGIRDGTSVSTLTPPGRVGI